MFINLTLVNTRAKPQSREVSIKTKKEFCFQKKKYFQFSRLWIIHNNFFIWRYFSVKVSSFYDLQQLFFCVSNLLYTFTLSAFHSLFPIFFSLHENRREWRRRVPAKTTTKTTSSTIAKRTSESQAGRRKQKSPHLSSVSVYNPQIRIHNKGLLCILRLST